MRHGLWVLALVSTVWLACLLFPVVWVVTGIGEANRPFIDLYSILAAADARQAGVDPFQPNNFDPYHRPHFYTDWWLGLGRLGLGRVDVIWLGYTLLAGLLLSALAQARPRTWREGVDLVLLLVSPAFLLAVNRANNDLVMFVIISLGLLLFRREETPWRMLAVVLFAVSAVLKYTPLITLVLLLGLDTRRQLLTGLALYVLVLLLAWPGLAQGLTSAARYTPAPDWLYAFGAPVAWRNLGFGVSPGWLLPAALVLGWAFWLAWKAGTRPESGSSGDLAAEREFICGAAMLAGVFFVGASFAYKFVFALWLLPRFWQQRDGHGVESHWHRSTWYLLLAVVWLEGTAAIVLNISAGAWSQQTALGVLKVALLASQVLTWALVACLLRFLFIYLRGRIQVFLLNRPPAAAGPS